MILNFKRLEKKYEVMDINFKEQDSITMTELFVKNMLDDEAQEVFYSELEDKEINASNVKDALFNAVLSQTSVNILKNEMKEYSKDPEKYQKKVNEFLQSESETNKIN